MMLNFVILTANDLSNVATPVMSISSSYFEPFLKDILDYMRLLILKNVILKHTRLEFISETFEFV
jgi:hypothetical protein